MYNTKVNNMMVNEKIISFLWFLGGFILGYVIKTFVIPTKEESGRIEREQAEHVRQEEKKELMRQITEK